MNRKIDSLLNYQQAAELLGLSENTLRKYVSCRVIPFVKIGRSVRFNPSELSSWIESNSYAAINVPRGRGGKK